MRSAALAILALLALVASAVALPAQEPTKNDLLRAVERQLKAAYETAGPAVACVVVSRSERYPKPAAGDDTPGKLGGFDAVAFAKANPTPEGLKRAAALDLSDVQNVPDHGFACAVVIDEKGLLLTPYHVIEGATKIYVHLPGRVGSYADVHAADARTDLAVLRLVSPPPGLKPIKFADVRLHDRGGLRATVVPGKLAVLMANPYVSGARVDRPSAALGSVTQIRAAEASETEKRLNSYYTYGPLLEHDAKLNAGISGAALLNLDGEPIGLTTLAPGGAGERAPGYAIPATEPFLRVVEVLRRGEEVEGGYLGVSLPVAATTLTLGGVTPLGPAAQAGLRANDTITHINGVRVATYSDLLAHVGPELAGARVSLTVRRFGNDMNFPVTLGKWPHDRPVIASNRPAAVFGLRVDHLSVLADRIGTNPKALLQKDTQLEGVSVREVAPDSPAAAAFKKLGDDPTKRWLITHVNGTAVATPADFYAAAKGQKAVKLTVLDPTEAKRPQREVSLP